MQEMANDAVLGGANGWRAVGAIWAAPALAQPDEPPRANVGGSDTCESPGNVQTDASAPVGFAPQYPYWEGDSVIAIPDEGAGDLVGLAPGRRQNPFRQPPAIRCVRPGIRR